MESENERSASEHSNFYGGTDYEKLADSTDTEVNEVEEQRGNVVVRYLLGGLALGGSLFAWDMMAELVQDLQEKYDKPYFLMWSLHSGYTIFLCTVLPAMWLAQCICKNTEPIKITWKRFGRATLYNTLLAASDYVWYVSLDHTLPSLNSAVFNTICVFAYLLSIPVLGHKFMWRKIVALIFCLSGMSGILVSSLDQPATNSTPTGNMTYEGCVADNGKPLPKLFNLSFSNPAEAKLQEDYTFKCYRAVQEDPASSMGSPLGYVLVVGAVVLFAVYEVVFAKVEGHGDHTKKKKVVDSPTATDGMYDDGFMHAKKKPGMCHKIADTVVTTGLMGLSNLMFLWVFFIVLHFTGVEKFNFPFEISTSYKYCCFSWVSERILINAALGSLYTSSFLIGITLTDPLFMSIGLILIIPIQFATDFINGKLKILTMGQGLGCALIIVGFFIINLPIENYLKKIKDDSKRFIVKYSVLGSLTFLLVVAAVIYAVGVGVGLWS